jgi:hypothetical protein
MRKEWFSAKSLLFTALGLLFAFAAYAAGDCGEGKTGGKRHRMMFDPKTVETISGEVVKVKEFTHRKNTGIGLILKTDKEEIPIKVGPASFLEKEGFKFGEKDMIEVTGSRITGKGGKTFVLASQVKKGGATLNLRDEKGFPVWSPKKDVKTKGAPATEGQPAQPAK